MPNVNTKAHVLQRDSFTCLHCGVALILSQAAKLLDQHVPDLELWDAHWNAEPLRSRGATVDHLTPVARGGLDDTSNLVACCVRCNSGRSVEAMAPPTKAPVHEGWDGLSRIFVGLAELHPHALSAEDKNWLAALERHGIKGDISNIDAVIEALRAAKVEGAIVLDQLLGPRSQPDV